MNNQISKPLALEGAYNVRDLGGHVNARGIELKTHQFLRSDNPSGFTQADKNLLLEYGVGAIIDLRSDEECNRQPCQFEEVDYYRIPMLDHMQSGGFMTDFPKSMSELYIGLLEYGKENFASILRLMIQYPDKCVLFNCSAGKDRTGVTAMLLQLLAGVDKETIIGEYAVSETYMAAAFDTQRAQLKGTGIDIPEYLLSSRPEEMAKTLEWLEASYGDIYGYLKSVGMDNVELSYLENKLLSEEAA